MDRPLLRMGFHFPILLMTLGRSKMSTWLAFCRDSSAGSGMEYKGGNLFLSGLCCLKPSMRGQQIRIILSKYRHLVRARCLLMNLIVLVLVSLIKLYGKGTITVFFC